VFNTNVGYPLDVETVYLPSQWGYLLNQGNTAISVVNRILRIFIASVHGSKVIQLCPIHPVSDNTMGSLITLSDILVVAFGKKRWLKAEMNLCSCIKHLVNGIQQKT